MYIKVKMHSKSCIITLSKVTTIEDLRNLIHRDFDVEPDEQRLFFKGKELVDGHRIVDYGVQPNNVIDLIKREKVNKSSKENDNLKKHTQNNEEAKDLSPDLIEAESKYFKVGDLVDFRSNEDGAWYEASITSVVRPKEIVEVTDEHQLIFKVKWQKHVSIFPFETEVKFDELRPVCFYTYKINELKKGMTVLANYNIENPKERGLWFDFLIGEVSGTIVKGEILLGPNKASLKDCVVKFIHEIMRIESAVLLEEKSADVPPIGQRKYPFHCEKCKDDPIKKCSSCGCHVCSGKEKWEQIILCDECEEGYHLFCLEPPLASVPEDNWYCPSCKNDDTEIVKAGEKLKHSNKKAKMPSSTNESNRDWGKGMACAGRTKECTIVPKYHLGPIPGIDVGTCWKFRVQVSEVGVHRPPVAGIHGRESDCAYSLVLSGGYEDDIDNGFEFTYSGAGGRDLSGNKRISGQSCDQELNRTNKALAVNCNAPFNQKGAESKNWKLGKPVRVVRSAKLEKLSKYAPKDGYRYDGIYKVVKYYPEKGKSGFLIWKYLLRRDDENPAPWEKGGKELDIIYPDGYLDAQETELKRKMSEDQNVSPTRKSMKRKAASPGKGGGNILTQFLTNKSNKKVKVEKKYKLEPEVEKAIQNDQTNEKLWNECKENVPDGKQKFLESVQTIFKCICCLDLLYQPVTLNCGHNLCKECLKRAFLSDNNQCPYCRCNLGNSYKMEINNNLQEALTFLFPGYGAGR